jgi:hypothetical protein
MDDAKDTLEREVSKGLVAHDLLSRMEPYVDSIRVNLINVFLTADPNDGDSLQSIRRQIEALTALWKLIEQEVDTGRMAKQQLEQEYEH